MFYACANCVISFVFIYLMLYVCATRFDVIKNFEKFLGFGVN